MGRTTNTITTTIITTTSTARKLAFWKRWNRSSNKYGEEEMTNLLDYFDGLEDSVAEERQMEWRIEWDMPEFEPESSGLYANEHVANAFFEEYIGEAEMRQKRDVKRKHMQKQRVKEAKENREQQ